MTFKVPVLWLPEKQCINVMYPVLFIEICSLKKPILMGNPVLIVGEI